MGLIFPGGINLALNTEKLSAITPAKTKSAYGHPRKLNKSTRSR